MDTDSVSSNTKVVSNGHSQEIEKLFLNNIRDEGDIHYIDDSEYIFPSGVSSLSFDPETNTSKELEIDYIYRHKVNKDIYEIEDEDGNIVEVTEDHSVMIIRNGKLVSATPMEIQHDDVLVGV